MKARWWFDASNGDVGIVLLEGGRGWDKSSTRQIQTEKWKRIPDASPGCVQTVIIEADGKVTGGRDSSSKTCSFAALER